MNTRVAVGLILTVTVLGSGPALGQGFVSSPSGYLTREGSGFESMMGLAPGSRNMFLDGEFRGSAMTLRGIDVRADYYRTASADVVGTTWVSMGRSWSLLTIVASECDINSTSTTFSSVPTTTPTGVFGARVSWPTIAGPSATKPAAWGHTSGQLRFPFITPWSYSGVGDLCLDFTFTGGVLSNRGQWQGSRTAYVLDSYVTGTAACGQMRQYGASLANGGCVDSLNGGFGGMGYPAVCAFSSTYVDPLLRNKLAVSSSARMTARGKPVFHAIGTIGSAAGYPFLGIRCNRLHLLMPTSLVFPDVADSIGSSFQQHGLVSYAASLVGMQLWGQSAWNDSFSGQLHLTSAFQVEVPEMPWSPKRANIWIDDPKASTGLRNVSSVANPLFRYSR